MLLVRCRTVDRTRAPSGENGRKANLNRASRASCTGLACCWSPLASTQSVVSPRPAVVRGRYMFSKKSIDFKGNMLKGYISMPPSFSVLHPRQRRRADLDGFRGGTPSSSPWAYFASDAINSTEAHLIRLTDNNMRGDVSFGRPSRRSRAQWARVVGKPQRKTLNMLCVSL